MTGDPSSSWRPSGDSCTLLVDTAKAWKRLTELTSLTWPTLGEQVERKVLVHWLNPATPQVIVDTQVFDVACSVHRIDPRSGEEFLRPVYAAANFAWQNIQRLADGQELEVPRPELSDDDFDAWRDKREEQAHSWLDTVLHELDMLASIDTNVIYGFRLPDLVQGTVLAAELREQFMKEVFAGPMAIGASMYLEPGEGLAFGPSREGFVSVMESLAFAVKQAVAALDGIDRNDKETFKTALTRVDFFWGLLKGYAWAGTYEHSSLVHALSFPAFASIWSTAQEALLLGRDTLTAALTDHPGSSLGGSGSGRSGSVHDTRVEELIDKMEECLSVTREIREINQRYK